MQIELNHESLASVDPLPLSHFRAARPSTTERPKLRVLHCVGHLLRGGIEMGLYNLLTTKGAGLCEHHVLVRTVQEEPFTGEFRKAGIAVLPCPSYRNPFRYARDLKQLVTQHGPYDILHVHGSSFSGLLTLALARYCGIPCKVVHSHNDVRPLLRRSGTLQRLYVRTVLATYRRLADRGFAASTLAAESMFGLKWKDDQRWQLFYYGIDCNAFKAPRDPNLRRGLNISESAMVIGHVGRFHEQKNHAFLLDIVEAAVRLDPSVVGLLIGDGPERADFVAQVRRRGLEAHFVFILDTLSVAAYMTSVMDCFVFPSRYEGLGLVVVEAQAAGLPCIISDRVPSDAIVNQSLVRVLPLLANAVTWAHAALRPISLMASSPFDALHQVEQSHFNLESSAAILWQQYARFARRSELMEPSPDPCSERSGEGYMGEFQQATRKA